MKKLIYILAIGLIPLASCEDELTQEPYNAMSLQQAFVTESDFTNAVRGAYAGLRGASYYGGQDAGSMIITPDILADNLIINSQGRKSQQGFFNYTYTPNGTSWSGLWNNAYTTINRSNYILENIDNLPAGAFKDNVRAEALALRALAHFDLLRVYGKKYIGASDADLGVPYVISTDANLLPARTPLKAAYALVVKDFTDAATTINAANGVGRLNKASVNALLGRVYLYMGEWQNAVNASTAAIDATPAANALATVAEFPGIWTDATNKDVLFKVKILDGDATTVGVGYGQTSPSGVRSEYSPAFDLFTLYKDADVRKASYIGQTKFNGFNFNFIKKHAGRATGNANVVDVKVIRTAEVYLNRAEAYYNLNKPAEALIDLNKVRSNRYSDFNALTAIEVGQPLYNAILLERRLELAFEGHRFFDLKRLGLGVDRSAFGDQADGAGLAPAKDGIPAGSSLFQLPIPQYEIDVNANIIQNDDY